jgi:LmbE family N-acetylglucosaminyl deacetylase
MLELDLSKPADSAYQVLCLGAHCDDIEIGCGGTILSLSDGYPNTTIYWLVFSSDQQRAREAEESADVFLRQARSKQIVIESFRNGFFPYAGSEIKEYFEQLKRGFSPDLIFTHYRHDLHQDHRLISELTWNTYRDHWILEYEIPKYDGDLGSPNLFVHLDEPTCHKKAEYILNIFHSQREKRWFDSETLLSILRLRGMESNAPSKYAEAFYCRKMVWGLGNQ